MPSIQAREAVFEFQLLAESLKHLSASFLQTLHEIAVSSSYSFPPRVTIAWSDLVDSLTCPHVLRTNRARLETLKSVHVELFDNESSSLHRSETPSLGTTETEPEG